MKWMAASDKLERLRRFCFAFEYSRAESARADAAGGTASLHEQIREIERAVAEFDDELRRLQEEAEGVRAEGEGQMGGVAAKVQEEVRGYHLLRPTCLPVACLASCLSAHHSPKPTPAPLLQPHASPPSLPLLLLASQVDELSKHIVQETAAWTNKKKAVAAEQESATRVRAADCRPGASSHATSPLAITPEQTRRTRATVATSAPSPPACPANQPENGPFFLRRPPTLTPFLPSVLPRSSLLK